MSGKSLYEAIVAGDDDGEGLGAAAWLGALHRASAARRAGLAWTAWSESDDLPLDEADEAPRQLAADDRPERPAFPARYASRGVTVVVGLGRDGQPYVAVEGSAAAVRVRLGAEDGGEVVVTVAPGARVAVALLEAPDVVELDVGDGFEPAPRS